MKIVYGVDFSELSRADARGAAALAGRLGAELVLVHVTDPAMAALAKGEAMRDATLAQLAAEASSLGAAFPDVSVRHEVVTGSATAALIAAAEQHEADLLVVSSQGHGDSPLFRVGGTSERLALEATRPTLVMRGSGAFEEWARGDRPLRVLVGVDESVGSQQALRWVAGLRQAGPCDLVAAHVYFGPDAARRYGVPMGPSWLDPDPELERMVLRDVARQVGDVPGAGEVELRVMPGYGRLADHLLQIAELERVDLVVTGTHQKAGLGRLASVSSGALHFGRMAVACVPAAAATREPVDIPVLREVVVATDLSPFANQAVAYAYGLLREGGGSVTLLHVADGGADEAEVTARLRQLVPPAAAARGISTRTRVITARDVPAAICAAAERAGADVVCIASHGRGGIVRAALGSVADNVMRQSHRPVLVVRPAE